MNTIIRFFVERSFYVNLIAVFICLVGLISLKSMKRDLAPPFHFNQISVTASLPGATPQEVEEFLTYPLEDRLAGLSGLETLTSNSRQGYMKIDLMFPSSDHEMTTKVEKVQSIVNNVKPYLPNDIVSLEVSRVESRDPFLFWLNLVDFDRESDQDRAYLKEVKRKILKVKGVSSFSANITERNIYIEFDLKKLLSTGLDAQEVRGLIRQSMNLTSVGSYEKNDLVIPVKMASRKKTIEAIGDIVLKKNFDGKEIRLADVAQVQFKAKAHKVDTLTNFKPSIGVLIRKTQAADLILVKERALKVINDLNSRSKKVKIEVISDGPYFLERQLDVLKLNGFLGFVIVFLVLLLFINWKVALMTTLGLPVAYLGAIAFLSAQGIYLTLISVIGMIIVIGILVDDAIIIAEKYTSLLEEGHEGKEAAVKAVQHLMIPVSGSILTTIIAFSPLVFVEGGFTKMLISIPMVVISALLLSWFESFFILPNHLNHFVKKSKPGVIDPFVKKLTMFYESYVKWSLKWRYLLTLIFLGILSGAGYVAVKKIKHQFNLRITSEKLAINVEAKDVSSNEETIQKLQGLYDHINTLPEAKGAHLIMRVGQVWMDGKQRKGPEFGRVMVYLDKSLAYPSQVKKSLKEKVNLYVKSSEATDLFKKIKVGFVSASDDEEKKNMVRLTVKGKDGLNFSTLRNQLEFLMKKEPSFDSVVVDDSRLRETWIFEPKSEKLKQMGFSYGHLARQLRQHFSFDKLMNVREGGESLVVFTSFKGVNKESDLDFDQLKGLQVISPAKTSVPLSFLGDWKKSTEYESISHKDLIREEVFEIKFKEDKINSTQFKKMIRENVEPLSSQYPNHIFDVDDLNKQEKEGKQWAGEVAMICILGVFFVLALVLGSILQPFLVSSPILFGFIGVVFALYLHDLPLGLMSTIGFIGIVGVSVNASLVLVDEINKKKQELGKILNLYIVRGAASRLRAILLTTLTTVAGIMPMAYSVGGEVGFTRPLAFSLGWGLVISSLLSLLLIPSFYKIQEDIVGVMHRVFRFIFKEKKGKEDGHGKEGLWSPFSPESRERKPQQEI